MPSLNNIGGFIIKNKRNNVFLNRKSNESNEAMKNNNFVVEFYDCLSKEMFN